MVAFKETSEQMDKEASIAIENPFEAKALLDHTRTTLKKRLSFFVWQGFFEPLSATSFENNCLTIEAPTLFHRNWVMDHYMPELIAAASEAIGFDIKVIISHIQDGHKKELSPKKTSTTVSKKGSFPKKSDLLKERMNNGAAVIRIDNAVAERTHENLLQISSLNQTYTFDSFIAGPSNQMCHAAALAVADHPGTQYSPLFIFGGVGLGKTHLLHAIGLHAKKQNPTTRILYTSSEQWVNSYIQAIRERKCDEFRNRFRNDCDILLIDDIQFLAGKDASQDEFFHTFNYLHEAKKQIVVTSDKYAHEIEGLEARLQTRLSWGLIVDIRPPEIETRMAILHKKAESLNAIFNEEVFNYLASNVTSSVRELEGALIRLSACSLLTKTEITLEKAKEFLSPMIRKKKSLMTACRIIEVVASEHDLKPADITGKSRTRQIANVRAIAMYLCRFALHMSLPEIGKSFGGRDHSTVLAAIKKLEAQKRKDIHFAASLMRIEEKLLSIARG